MADEIHDFSKKIFNKSLGVDATVERSKTSGETSKRANEALREIGRKVKPEEHFEYLGSAAFHVYQTPGTKHTIFLSQVQTMQDCDELTAQAASQNFMGDIIEFYTGKRPGKMRSGF